ncbi:MAG: FAD-dependent oxidoreductase [Cypionkella sp.]
MKSHARVVIVGGGVMGVGLLYHLALEGWTDIVLIEKGELTSGSTWHAAGQCPHFNGSLNMTKVHLYGTELYPQARKAHRPGRVLAWLRRLAPRHHRRGSELAEICLRHLAACRLRVRDHRPRPRSSSTTPILETFGIKAAFRTVHDGHVAPADITNAMAAGARQLGAEIYRRNRVTDIKLLPNGEWRVFTEQGNIDCEHVVNSAGSYCDVVGSWTGHNVPIANMLHHYIITEPLQGADRPRRWNCRWCAIPTPTPICARKPMACWSAPTKRRPRMSAGTASRRAGITRCELEAPELDRLMPWLEKATERLPLFGQTGIKSIVSGAITHTPDGTYLSGPAPGPKNYWMHCGASIGICQGGGAGKYLAQWMVHGQAEINMREFDPRRFGNWATKDYTAEVSVADYHHMYYCYKPAEQHEVGRGLRKSSLYDKLKAEGAQFAQIFGWERPRWYDKSGEGREIFLHAAPTGGTR